MRTLLLAVILLFTPALVHADPVFIGGGTATLTHMSLVYKWSLPGPQFNFNVENTSSGEQVLTAIQFPWETLWLDSPFPLVAGSSNLFSVAIVIPEDLPPLSVYDSVTCYFQPVATPEPATLLLLGSGLVGVAGYARRKRNAKVS